MSSRKEAGTELTLIDFIIPYQSPVIGRPLLELHLPDECVITLLSRGPSYIVPTGSTVLQGGDVLLVLLNKSSIAVVQDILAGPKAQIRHEPDSAH